MHGARGVKGPEWKEVLLRFCFHFSHCGLWQGTALGASANSHTRGSTPDAQGNAKVPHRTCAPWKSIVHVLF